MSKVKLLRASVNQRLTLAAEEILELFESAIAGYEEELRRCKEENKRKQKLLDAVFNPEVRVHRADVEKILVKKENVVSEQQKWSSSPDPEKKPEVSLNKEEQEKLWINAETEQIQRLGEADIMKVECDRFPVKYDDCDEDEEKPKTSQLCQAQAEESRRAECFKTEADGEDCGGSDQDRHFYEDPNLQSVTLDNTLHSGSETDDSCDWEVAAEDLDPVQNKEQTENNIDCHSGEKVNDSDLATCPKKRKKGIQNGPKSYSCKLCGKNYKQRTAYKNHLRYHPEVSGLLCPLCQVSFPSEKRFNEHMSIHSREKPFRCTICGEGFLQRDTLKTHQEVHRREKSVKCSLCNKCYTPKYVKHHKCVVDRSTIKNKPVEELL